jgi:hypothetical protein
MLFIYAPSTDNWVNEVTATGHVLSDGAHYIQTDSVKVLTPAYQNFWSRLMQSELDQFVFLTTYFFKFYVNNGVLFLGF